MKPIKPNPLISEREFYLRSFTWGLPVNIAGAFVAAGLLATGRKELGRRQHGHLHDHLQKCIASAERTRTRTQHPELLLWSVHAADKSSLFFQILIQNMRSAPDS